MKRSNIFDVAKLAGVSIKTVSRVVNHEPNVRASTKERVDKAISELKYRPDQSARNLASHRSHLIGLVYDDPAAYELPSSGYIIKMQHGALKACRSVLSELLIHPCDYRRKNVGAELRSLIEDARPAGIILAAPLSNMPKIVRAIEATGTPCVRLSPGKTSGKKLSVATNDREVSAEMTRYLAGLGHTRIAFITGDPEHKAVANRYLGYQDGLSESGIEFSTQLVAAGDNSFGSGEACAEELLRRKSRPTAIFAANDDMAAGVIRAAHRMGIDMPGQLSVAGFDDITLSSQLDPTLTTIRQPLVRMTERAALMLAKGNGRDKDAGSHEIVPAEIQIRESTGPAPG
jgi:LacI family transcriptional regulator